MTGAPPHGARPAAWPAGVAFAALLGAALGWPGAHAAAAPAVRALVIGIDAYAELHDLAGAVNDARDVAQALATAGVTDLVLLEDAAASRVGIASAWRGLLARARPGDTLVLTFAGHGGQEPERVPGSERDGLDEVLLLGGFRSAGPGTRERIRDDELHGWFLDAGERGLQVLFIADSCHAGTLTRGLDPRVPATALRTARYTITDDMLTLAPPDPAAARDEVPPPHVSFLAAGQEHEQVPEVVVPGASGRPEARGALSYVFARALEGRADLDGDRVLRRAELWRFVRENVRMMSEARQTPNLLPNGRGGEPVLALGAPGSHAVPAPAESVTPDRLRLAVRGADARTLKAVIEALPGVQVVAPAGAPDLLWDAPSGEVVTGLGDVAARDVDAEGLPGVIAKWAAVRAIRALSAAASLRLRVRPHDGVHRRGERVEVVVDGLSAPRLTLLALAGDGTVQYLYPLASDADAIVPGRPFRLPLDVTPPFGADHVVAVSAGSALDGLNAALRRLDGTVAPGRAAALLNAAAAAASGWWSGIQGLVSAP